MKRFVLMFVAVALLWAIPAFGATVVVNSEVEIADLDPDTLGKIFLGKKTLWESGQRITPVLMKEGSGASKLFLEEILNKSVSQYRAYWKKRLFSGGGIVPKTFRTEKEVIEFVEKTPGAIGVVASAPKGDGVTILQVTR